VKLYVVRHGEAGPGLNDGSRSLTENGHEQARLAGALLAQELPEIIIHSPKLRTRQTAAEIAACCAGAELAEDDRLLPPSSGREVADMVETGGGRSVVIVSHMPLVAELVGWFCRGDARDHRLHGFPPAGIVALEMDFAGAGAAAIEWCAFPPDYRKAPAR
jgi:phosphohistidine phosphatase SixA